ncbi:MAG TPA: hypothetical protein ENI23_08520 [bacterium]|nr:hypothetical protein [bacterium]
MKISECLKWYDTFSLKPYKLFFHFGLEDNDYRNAYNRTNYDNHTAHLYFDKNYGSNNELEGNLTEDIKRTAKHEMTHILLNRLTTLGRWRYTTNEELKNAEEELVRKLEDLIA